jgi:surface carbohydrate biosynthesis protein (TIGR04326 family)
MKILFVFDDKIRVNKINLKDLGEIKVAYLFPLTSKTSVMNKVKGVLDDKKIRVEILNTSSIINQSADEIRNLYIKFIAELPERLRIKDRNLREYFATPDKIASLWWFSLVAEKNTIKSDSFNKMSQLHSIAKYAKKINAGHILYGATCNRLKKSLISYSHSKAITFQKIPTKLPHTLREVLYNFQGFCSLKHFLIALYTMYKMLSRAVVIKIKLRNIRKTKILKNPILIITQYPYIDIKAAMKGTFRNKYYPLLQEELERERRDIVWLAVYTQNNNITFNEALGYAEQFVKNGYNFYFLDEFLDFKDIISVVQTYVLGCFKFLKIRKNIPELHFFEEVDYNFFLLLKEEWYSSYVGSVAISGIVQYEKFKNIFGKHHFGDTCLYYFENHAWEKAMICARDHGKNNLKLLGYQHSTVARMLLNYFNHKSETSEEKVSFPLPKPDKIICNGNIPFNYMKESGWPDEYLCIAEAIRYNNIKYVNRIPWVSKKDIFLIALSIGFEESVVLLNFIYEGFMTYNSTNSFKIWIKPHPFLNIKRVLENTNIDFENTSFEIKEDPIENLLSMAKVVLAGGESGVSLEALAFGCKVISLNLPEGINMSSLRNVQSDCVIVASSSKELISIVNKQIFKLFDDNGSYKERESIMHNFFYLNTNIAKPEKLLKCIT